MSAFEVILRDYTKPSLLREDQTGPIEPKLQVPAFPTHILCCDEHQGAQSFVIEHWKACHMIFRITIHSTTIHRSRTSPLALETNMLPLFASSSPMKNEQVKQSPDFSLSSSHTEHAPSSIGRRRKNTKKAGKKQRPRSFGSRRGHFSRMESSNSTLTPPTFEENQTRETQILEMDQFLGYTLDLDDRGRRSKSFKKTGPPNPSSRRTTSTRTDSNKNLAATPLRNAPAEMDDLPKKRRPKRTHAVFPQLRFENGRADVDYVRKPLVSSVERKNTSKKKPHAAEVLSQLQIPASTRVTSLDDLDVQQYVRRAPRMP